MAKLSGEYHIHKAALKRVENPDFQLIICKRQQASLNKPINYLLLKHGRISAYVSSLYPISEGSSMDLFKLDYEGQHYQLLLDRGAGKAIIRDQAAAISRAA